MNLSKLLRQPTSLQAVFLLPMVVVRQTRSVLERYKNSPSPFARGIRDEGFFFLAWQTWLEGLKRYPDSIRG
jgi:hypothetical protein